MTEATLTWTDERVERLKTLWQEGKSASTIAAELGGVSRNAVIGKVHRLGLSGRGKTPEKAAAPRRPKVSVSEAAPQPAPAAQPVAASASGAAAVAVARVEPIEAAFEAPRPLRRTEEIVVPISERVTIMDLRESMCRWPLGDPSSPDFRFCGCRTAPGMTYCDAHAQIAYQPSADRRRDRKAAAG